MKTDPSMYALAVIMFFVFLVLSLTVWSSRKSQNLITSNNELVTEVNTLNSSPTDHHRGLSPIKRHEQQYQQQYGQQYGQQKQQHSASPIRVYSGVVCFDNDVTGVHVSDDEDISKNDVRVMWVGIPRKIKMFQSNHGYRDGEDTGIERNAKEFERVLSEGLSNTLVVDGKFVNVRPMTSKETKKRNKAGQKPPDNASVVSENQDAQAYGCFVVTPLVTNIRSIPLDSSGEVPKGLDTYEELLQEGSGKQAAGDGTRCPAWKIYSILYYNLPLSYPRKK